MASKSSAITFYLPESIVVEILCRLPVKSLLRFKCVCKSWCSLITSPEFISMHLENYASSYYLFHGYEMEKRTPIVSLVSPTMDKKDLTPIELDLPALFNSYATSRISFHTNLYGPCNGIFCTETSVFREKSIALWNPATKEFKPLAGYKIPDLSRSSDDGVIGFGFDAKTNNYKVLLYSNSQYFLYSLRNDSCKKLETTPHGRIGPPTTSAHLIPTSVSFKNNRVCWFARDENRKNSWEIALFDVVEETFKMIRLPPDIEKMRVSCRKREVLLRPYREDSVALIIIGNPARDDHQHQCPPNFNYYHVWVTTENNSSSLTSWIKLFSVKAMNDIDLNGPYDARPVLLGFSEDERLIFQPRFLTEDGRVILVDPSTGETKRHLPYKQKIRIAITLGILAYKESLVSLNIV